MRRLWAATVTGLTILAACGSDDPSTVAPASTTTTMATTTTATDGTCPDTYPPFGTTWLPDEWRDESLVPGSGGDDAEQCGVYHWGGDGRYVDVRVGDGAQSFGAGTRTITVLGRPEAIGPIHEGFMVRTDTHALLAYGVTDEVLQRIAEGLFVQRGGPVAERAPGRDGTAYALVLSVDDGAVTIDPIGRTGDDEEAVSQNADPSTVTLPVADDAVVTSPWALYGSEGCELCQRVISYDRLREIFAGPEPEAPEANVRHDPFWVTVTGGEVTRLDEQYVP